MSATTEMKPLGNIEATRRIVRAGLVGAEIQKSRSPALHCAEGAANGLDYSYELIDLSVRGQGPEALPGILAEVEARGFHGINVTFPCKQAIIPHLDDLSEDARALGAVNTVVLSEGRRVGHNTDWSGFKIAFERGLPDVARDVVVLLGAGGAGSAVAHAAMKLGTGRLLVFDREPERAERLAAELGEHFPGQRAEPGVDIAAAMAAADGLVHCTPMGMARFPGLPLPGELLAARHWVAEIVYFPLETELLRVARARGCRTLDGGGMNVFQAAEAFRLFSGVTPDPDRMLRHFASMGG